MLIKVTKITVTNCNLTFDSIEKMKALKQHIAKDYNIEMAAISFDLQETE